MRFKWFIAALVVMTVWGTGAVAEDIKNDSGCDVCAGAVHFGPDETREIFGDEIREKINDIWWQGQKEVWIDLDGVLKSTETPSDKSAFEILVYGTVHKVFIKSLMDDSVIELVINTFDGNEDDKAATLVSSWRPEIYIYAGHTDPIDLEDSLDAAWSKLEERHVVQWAGNGKDVRTNPEEMRKRILGALNALAP